MRAILRLYLLIQPALERPLVCYSCILAVKQYCDLFERRTAGLNEEKVDAQDLDDENDDVDEVELPGELL